ARPRVGRARASRRGARALRHGARGRDRPDRHGDHAPGIADRRALTPVPGPETVRAFTLEIGLGALLLLVFVANLGVRGGDRRVVGWIASGGVLVLALTSFLVRPAPPALGGMFVQDGLAIFAKRLFLVYGAVRSTDLATVARASTAAQPLLTLGLLTAFAGFGFKIAAFPFHMWVPDTYEAASTPFVAWLSVAPKAAGFVALFRVYLEGVGDRAAAWIPLAAGLATLTIVAGNLMALPQQNTKRLLAYSGIAHIGYMLVGFAAASASGVAMVLFYLVTYVFGNMGAFLVVEAVARSEGSEATTAFRGLAQRSPLLALAMLIFLLSLGGIPFVAGFWAKLYVFWAAASAGLYWLVLVGAVLTVVALFYYLV